MKANHLEGLVEEIDEQCDDLGDSLVVISAFGDRFSLIVRFGHENSDRKRQW
jgi:hypothetical protein